MAAPAVARRPRNVTVPLPFTGWRPDLKEREMRLTLILATTTAVMLAACARTPPPQPLQTCPTGEQIPANQPCPTPPPPPPPPPVTCPDGTTVAAGQSCPLPPPPPPPPPARRAGERG
jgi:hypothetical protein